MASTASTSLRLELMGTGDQTGTWGATTNTNLGTLLEQAICGYVAVTHDNTATYTLTTNNYASDEARNMVLDVGGTLTAARNLVAPTAEKVYLIKNSTVGGYAFTIKTASGIGVSIANGTAQWVYCDGTNVVQGLSGTMAVQTASAVAITGGTISGLTTLGASAAAITGGTVLGLTSLRLTSGTASPTTDDAAALGTTALGWADLFLATGGTLHFANTDWVATHSTGILTVGTGDLRVTTAGTNAASVVTVGGTQTLTNKTLTTPVFSGTPTGIDATTSAKGISEFATAAEYRTGTDTARSLVVDQVWASAAEVTLTDAVTITVDGATFINAVVTLAGNRTLGTWSNAKVGQSGFIRVVQDATGSRTLAYHADYEFAGSTAVVLSTTAAAQDMLFYQVIASGRVLLSIVKAIG